MIGKKGFKIYLFIYLQIIFGPGPVRRNQRVVKISCKKTLFLGIANVTGISESTLYFIGDIVFLLINLSLRSGASLDFLVLTMSFIHSYRS